MKRYTSRFLKSVALFYMAFPMAYLFVTAMVFDMPVNSCVQLLLSPFYYVVSLIAVIAGYGLWEMYRWSWYLYIASNVFIGYQTALVMNQFSESHHKVLGFVISLIAIVGIAMRVSREVRVPYFFPKIRWWESNPRYRLAVQSEIVRTVTGNAVIGEILDLSLGGCFIKLRADLKSDEPVTLKFEVFKLPVEVQGVVVWRSESTVTHPKGVGIKFSTLERSEKRALRLIAKRLRAIANFYRTSRYLLSQEDFLKKLQEIEGQEFGKRKKIQIKESAS
jgi:hypothetical protein